MQPAAMDEQATSTGGQENNAPLCKLGETAQYMMPTIKQFPKLEPRFFTGTWLGKGTTAVECIIGIYNRMVRARATRRQVTHHKHNQQLLDCVNPGPWKTPASTLPTRTLATPVTMPATGKAPTSRRQETERKQSRRRQLGQHHQWLHHQHISGVRRDQRCQHYRLPHLQEKDDAVAEASAGKQQRTTAEGQALARPTATQQLKGKMRINATNLTANGDRTQRGHTSQNERALLEPIAHDTEGLDPQLVSQGMKNQAE